MRDNFELTVREPIPAPGDGPNLDGHPPLALDTPAIGSAQGFDLGQRALQAISCLLAVALHVGAIALTLARPPDDHGDDGTRLEAIAVSIVVNAPSSAGTGADQQSLPQSEPPAETSPANVKAEPERKIEEPTEPELTPPQPETERPVAQPKSMPKPTAVTPWAAQDQPATASVSKASTGVMRVYARQVAQTIARAKTKGTGRRGSVRIKFVIGPTGRTDLVEVVLSSGQPNLDRIARSTISRTAFPAPPPNADAGQRTFFVPFDFR
jgi:protein TonB